MLAVLVSDHLSANEIPFDRFVKKYSQWLNFDIENDLTYTGSFLDLACCTITSRHLDPATRVLLAPRLQKLAEQSLLQTLMNPRNQTQQSIKALLILSLWSPICGGSSESGLSDGRCLTASIVSLAINLGINRASSDVVALSEALRLNLVQGEKDEATLQDLKNQARLVRRSILPVSSHLILLL
jgi:hypothetical protein